MSVLLLLVSALVLIYLGVGGTTAATVLCVATLIGLFQDGFHGFQYSNAILIGYLLGALDIGIIQPHELHITHLSHLGINPDMMLA